MSVSRQAVVIAFLVGLIAGVFGGAMFQRHMFRRLAQRGPDTQRALKRLSRELSLDPKQQDAVKAALERHRADMDALHKQTMERMDQIRDELHAEIEPLLNPDQKAKFAELKARWERRRAREGPPPPPPPAP